MCIFLIFFLLNYLLSLFYIDPIPINVNCPSIKIIVFMLFQKVTTLLFFFIKPFHNYIIY